MIFKEPDRMVSEYWKITPKMRLILSCAEYWCSKNHVQMVVTSLMRTEEEQQKLVELGVTLDKLSVHQFGRGVDIRLLEPYSLNQDLVDYINFHYTYDPLRPKFNTALIHKGTADHIHLQSIE